MKITKVKEELRALNLAQLKEQEENVLQEWFVTRVNARTGHIKDNSRFNKLRKLVARIKTYIRQQELQQGDK